MLPWLLLLLVADPQTQPRTAAPPPTATQRPAPPRNTFFTSTLQPAELQNKQAVLETSDGAIVFDLLGDAAPNHVAHFITRAREGAYDGTTFHRVIAMGIIQGGDPLSKDPAQSAKYGTGGLNELRFEPNAEKHTRGAVSAVLVPGNRDSAGSQFFIAVTDQPALDGQYTVFARVAEGITVAQKISTAPATGHRAGGADRDQDGHHSRQAGADAGAVLDRDGRRAVGRARRHRDVDGQHHARVLSRSRARSTCASFCGWPRPVSTTAPRSTASSAAS